MAGPCERPGFGAPGVRVLVAAGPSASLEGTRLPLAVYALLAGNGGVSERRILDSRVSADRERVRRHLGTSRAVPKGAGGHLLT